MNNNFKHLMALDAFTQVPGALIIIAILMFSSGFIRAEDVDTEGNENRHYDARISFNKGFSQVMSQPSQQIISKMAKVVPDLAYSVDKTSGVVRSLTSHTSYLTPPNPGQEPMAVVMDFLKSNANMMGMSQKEIANMRVTDQVYSKISGVTHIYMNQVHKGLPVYFGQLQMNTGPEQRILSINNNLTPGMEKAANTTKASIDLAEAVSKAAQHLALSGIKKPKLKSVAKGIRQQTTVEHNGISLEPIQGSLMWLPIRHGMMNLVWNFQIHTLVQQPASSTNNVAVYISDSCVEQA